MLNAGFPILGILIATFNDETSVYASSELSKHTGRQAGASGEIHPVDPTAIMTRNNHATDSAQQTDALPLEGLRIIDAGNLIAGPFGASLLGDFGAEVIKIEHPKLGDGHRHLDPEKDGVPLWWKVTGRNKKAITLDLSTEMGTEVFKDLIRDADVVIENYRPGTMDRWNIGYSDLKEENSGIIMLHVSGYGQTGPYKDRPGFGRVAGAMSGLTNLIGEPDGPPMSPGFPLADGITGMMGALSVMMAVHHRDVNGGAGQEIDLALYEPIFRMIEFLAIEYDQLGEIRSRTGNRHAYVAPSSTYNTSDGEYVTMAASTESIWRRLCRAMNKEELLDDPRFANHKARNKISDEVNDIVAEWIGAHTRDEVEEAFVQHEVAHSFVYTIEDIFNDAHYQARENIVSVQDDELGEAKVQNVIPKYSETPGRITHLGPRKGEHNDEIYGSMLGYSDEMIEELRERSVI